MPPTDLAPTRTASSVTDPLIAAAPAVTPIGASAARTDGQIPTSRATAPAARTDRPRERLLRCGAEGLCDEELVAVVLGTGLPGGTAGTLAARVLDRAGTLRRLLLRTPSELAELPGVGEARAARLLACAEIGRRVLGEPLRRGRCYRSSRDVFRHYGPRLRDLRVEQFLVILLDGKHRVLREVLVSQGTLTSSPVHPREVFGPAMRHSAAAVVLLHNHPSGDPTPSADDLEVTRRLREVGDLVGIQVLDHVIVGDGSFASLADRGLL